MARKFHLAMISTLIFSCLATRPADQTLPLRATAGRMAVPELTTPFGGPGNDLLADGDSDDSVIDWAPDVGHDTCRRGAGFDRIAGADRFTGQQYVNAGADTLNGALGGADVLTGGAARDVFEFGATRLGQSPDIGVSTGRIAETITDFTSGHDKIALNLYSRVGLPPPMDDPLARAEFGLIGSGDLTDREKMLDDPTSGTLFKAGAGHIGNGATNVFAHVTPGTPLTCHDFVWFTVDI